MHENILYIPAVINDFVNAVFFLSLLLYAVDHKVQSLI